MVIEAKIIYARLVVDLSSVYVTSHKCPVVDLHTRKLHYTHNLVKTVIGKINVADSTPLIAFLCTNCLCLA